MPRFVRWALALAAISISIACCTVAAIWTLSRKPGYCGSCHVMAPYYRSWADSDYLAKRHAAASVKCQDCHPQGMGRLLHEVVNNALGNYTEPLPALRMTKSQCLNCHGDYSLLAAATSQLKINPHASHLGEEECQQCHKMHRQSPGLNFCYTCHHTGTLDPCKKCHTSDNPGGAS
jgi:cytochrome c nitrite reductase small subunit